MFYNAFLSMFNIAFPYTKQCFTMHFYIQNNVLMHFYTENNDFTMHFYL